MFRAPTLVRAVQIQLGVTVLHYCLIYGSVVLNDFRRDLWSLGTINNAFQASEFLIVMYIFYY